LLGPGDLALIKVLAVARSFTRGALTVLTVDPLVPSWGHPQLTAFEPIIAHSLFKSITHLRNGCLTLTERCVKGITANRERLRSIVENSIGVVTALNPYIGYANATQIAQEALATGRSVYDLVLERKLLSKERLDEILQPEVLTRPRAMLEAGRD